MKLNLSIQSRETIINPNNYSDTMNTKIVDAMIADGYTAADIIRYEKCDHHFIHAVMVNRMTGEISNTMICGSCFIDAHGARLMGVDIC